jgi:hypothetical protein
MKYLDLISMCRDRERMEYMFRMIIEWDILFSHDHVSNFYTHMDELWSLHIANTKSSNLGVFMSIF